MAQSVIGALRVNLGLDSAKFESGTKKATKTLGTMRKQFAVVATAAAAMGAAIGAAAMKGAQEIDKSAKAARRLDASIGAFRALEVAAGEAGVPLSSLTNDIQSMNRELANIGTSGNADRALERLGLNAADLAGSDADEKIATIADRVKEMGMSAGEATAVLRDLGVRNREMALLMIGGGDAIRKAREDVEQYGLALSSVDAAKIEQANDRLGRLGIVSQYVGQQLAMTLVPAFGQLAVAITDSMREGGALRAVLDGMIGNLDRLAAYVSVVVAAFGTRYVGALIAARLATLSLSGALATLRTALIRTGFGILIVGAGEAVLWFGRLVSAAGGFGEAMASLKDVAVEIWDRIGLGAQGMVEGMKGMWHEMRSSFLDAISKMASAAHDMLWNLSKQFSSVGMEGFAETAMTAADALSAASKGPAVAAQGATDEAAGARGRAAGLFNRAGASLESLAGLRGMTGNVATETDTATGSIDAMNDAIADTGEAVGGSAGGGRSKGPSAKDSKSPLSEAAQDAIDALEESERKAAQAADRIRTSMTDGFKGILTGANSLRDSLSSVFASIADMMLTNAGDALFGGFASRIGGAMVPAFANGTNYAPGGMAMVGERGPELVNLPRGSQVVPNHKLPEGGGGSTTFNIDARGADQAAVSRLEAWAGKFSNDFATNVHKTLRASGNAGMTMKVTR